MLELLNTAILNIEEIIKLFDDYHIRISEGITTENANINTIEDIRHEINPLMANFNNIIKKINLTITDTTYDLYISKMFKLINTFFHIITNLYEIYDIYINGISVNDIDASEFSGTYKNEAGIHLHKTRIAFIKYDKSLNALQIKIFDKISNNIVEYLRLVDDIMPKVLMIFDTYKRNTYTTMLFTSIIKNILDKIQLNDETNHIYKLIENEKTRILSGFATSKWKTKKKDTNPRLKSFNLITISNNMDLDAVFDLIDDTISVTKSNDDISRINEFSKLKQLNFIIIRSYSYDPVKYNIMHLLFPEHIIDNRRGIDKDIIDNFALVKPVKLTSVSKWETKYILINKNKSANYIILESIVEGEYRFISNKITSDIHVIPETQIANFINFIKNNIDNTDKTANYNCINNKQILRNMFLQNELSQDSINENAREINSQYFRSTIFLKTLNHLKMLMKTKYNNCKHIKSIVDINELIHDDSLLDLLRKFCISMYDEGTKTILINDVDTVLREEILISFLQEVETFVMRFLKELHDNINNYNITIDLANIVNQKKIIYIEEMLETILNKILSLLASNNDNIFFSISLKYFIMTYS